jgi:hypothetical protein
MPINWRSREDDFSPVVEHVWWFYHNCNIWQTGAFTSCEHFFHGEVLEHLQFHTQCQEKQVECKPGQRAWFMCITTCGCCPIIVRRQRWIKHIRFGTTIQRRTIWRMEHWLWRTWRLSLFDDDDHVEMPPPPIAMFNPTRTPTTRALGPTSSSQLPPHPQLHVGLVVVPRGRKNR